MNHINDARYKNIHMRLSLLSNEQLHKIIVSENMCYDSYFYDETNNKYCVLATAFDVEEKLKLLGISPTNQTVEDFLKVEAGDAFGTVKGVPGDFYRNNREEDVKQLCINLIVDRYEEFLKSQCDWTHYICDQCGDWSTHPLNYCNKCPGKIVNTKVTWLEHCKLARKKYGFIDTAINHFYDKISYPSNLYYLLVDKLKELMYD